MSLRRSVPRAVAVFLLSLLVLRAEAQKTIHIPADQPTIQAGINAASNGDTVLVAPGTYYENIDFKGKAITVTSSDGAAKTILDGGGKGPAVTLKTGEPRTAVLSNMTIQHGGNFQSYTQSTGVFLEAAGGIYIYSSSPSLLNNIVTQNNCWDIETNGAAPLIQGNEISATQDPKGSCTFGGGAAIYVGGNLGYGTASNTSPLILGNTIENNVESGLEDAGGNGGAGIAVWNGSPVIENNVIRNNDSPGGSGGAINVEGGFNVVIAQNLMYGNHAGCGGGALAFEDGSLGPTDLVIANNTIVDNTGVGTAGYSECSSMSQIYPFPGRYGYSGPSAIIVNNILSGSTVYPALNCDQLGIGSSAEADQPIFDHNILLNNGGPFFGSKCADVSARYGNQAIDPQFVNPAAGDYHLRASSPAIDAGNNSVLQTIAQFSGSNLTRDFDLHARVQDTTGKGYPVVDIGAYEYTGLVETSSTTAVLTASSYTGAGGFSDSLTAAIASPLGVPTGSAIFYLDGQQIGSSTLNANGIATLGSVVIVPGTHSLYVSYPGQGVFTPATSVVILVWANVYSTSLTLTSSANPSVQGQPVTFTVTGSSPDHTIPSPLPLTDSTGSQLLATLTLNSAGTATYTTSALALGYHYISVGYAGDALHAAATVYLSQNVVSAYPTATSLTCTPSSIPIGSSAALKVAVASSNGVPTGSIAFTDGAASFGQATLSGGSATFSYLGQTAGTHTLTASYTPTGSFASSAASCTETVVGLSSTAILTASPVSGSYGTPVALTATVSPAIATGSGVPTGTVTFRNGVATVGSATLNGGLATLTNSTLPAGMNNLTCSYSGDTVYQASTCNTVPVIITASPTALTITSSANPTLSLVPVTFTARLSINGQPAGAGYPVTFTQGNGSLAILLGTAATDASGTAVYTTSQLSGPLVSTISAVFSPTSSLLGSSASMLETITANPTTTTLTATPNPAYQSQTVTLATSIATASPNLLGGTMTFYDGSVTLGTAKVDSTGHASLTTSTLAVGTHSLSASFAPLAPFDLPSVSPAVQETILASAFTLTLSPSAITLSPSQSGTVAIQLASIGNFAGLLTLTHGAMPTYGTATIAPGSVTLNAGGTATANLSLVTSARSAGEAPQRPGSRRLAPVFAAGVLILLPLASMRRYRQRLAGRLLTVVLAMAALQGLTGCTWIYYAVAHVSPGSYQLPITATDTNGNSQSKTLTIVVTP